MDLNKLSYQDFKKFVNDQDPDKTINHINGYVGCIVGLYIQHKFPHAADKPFFGSFCYEFIGTLPYPLSVILPTSVRCEKLLPSWKEVQLYIRSHNSSMETIEEIRKRGPNVGSTVLKDVVRNRVDRGCRVSQWLMNINTDLFDKPSDYLVIANI